MAASKDGAKVWAWGAGHYGQLGVGGLEPRLSPSSIIDLEGQRVIQVSIFPPSPAGQALLRASVH